MYKFYFKYIIEGVEKLIKFPIAPDCLKTEVKNNNKTIETIGLGEVNLIKNIGLRELSFRAFLPYDYSPFGVYDEDIREPIFYLASFREIMANKCIVTLLIERKLPNGSRIFDGNMQVSLENYTVNENAGEEGSFWVDIKLKEYRRAEVKEFLSTGITNNGLSEVTQNITRDSKDTAKVYTVRAGDSLWAIAKRELNDGSRYKEIAEINGISNPNKISIGMQIKLP